jgi:hypothetical protein
MTVRDNVGPIADRVAKSLEASLGRLPNTFCSGFEYTSTGQNLTHPIIIAELARIVANEQDVGHVGIDVRLNSGRSRFQPDVVGFDKDLGPQPKLLIDYESPNSSDERIIAKDLEAYARWREVTGFTTPYIVITTLPSVEVQSKDWKILYTSYEGYGWAARSKKAQAALRRSPLKFWADVWRQALKGRRAPLDMTDVAILNIDRQFVSRVDL